mgnify:CR=1 FL=1
MINKNSPQFQCSMGVEKIKRNNKFRFNLIFFVPEIPKDKLYPFITEEFNYFMSKAVFLSDEEANLYGTLFSAAIQICVTDFQDVAGATEMLSTAMDRGTCPEDYKEEIEEHYYSYQDELEGEMEVAEQNIDIKKEDLN